MGTEWVREGGREVTREGGQKESGREEEEG